MRRLFAAHEDTRRRISGELHDEFGQQLTVLRLRLGELRKEYGGHGNFCSQLASLDAIAKQLDLDAVNNVANMRAPEACPFSSKATPITRH